MKLKKVLSGFLSAAILATTTAVVMPLEASAAPATTDTEVAKNVSVTSGQYDATGGSETGFTGYSWGSSIACDDYDTLEMTFEAANWGNAKCLSLVINSGDTEENGTAYQQTTSWGADTGEKTYKFDLSTLAGKTFNFIGYKIYRADENSDTDFNGEITIKSVVLTAKESVEYAEQTISNPPKGEIFPGTLDGSKINGKRAKMIISWTADESNNGIQVQNKAGTTVATFSGYGSTGAITKEVLFSDFTSIPDEFKLNTWGVSSIESLVISNDKTKGNVYTEGSADVAVESVAITGTGVANKKLSLEKGKDATLTATVTPDEASAEDKAVTWAVSTAEPAGCVTVDATGKVTAVAAGKATVTATTAGKDADGNAVSDSVEVTVTNPATAIAIDETASVLIGAEKTLAVTTTPADADELTYTWTSSKPEIATVTNGVVKGIAAGEAVITVKAGALEDTCTVTVTADVKPITKLEISEATLELEEGKTGTLTSTATPADTTDEIEWITSDANVATVKDGVVTAVAEGKATITVQVKGNSAISASCEVTVTKKVIAITGVTLDKTTATVEEGKTVTLNATVAPADTTEDKTVTWKSSDETVATVKDGVVTAVKAGTANITATAGGKTATCAVTVTAKAEDPKPSGNALWEGTQDMTWSDSIQIAKEKFADLKAGDTIEITVTKAASGAQISLKSMGEGWPALPAFKKIDPEWGCDNISKADTYKYVMTEDDVKVLKADGMVVGGHDYTVTSVKLVAAAEEPADKTEYETGKAETVKDYVPKETPAAGTKTELKVNSISADDAAKYSSYDITITVTLKDGAKKTATKSVSDCYKGFTYNNGTDNTTVKAAEGFFILVKVKNVPDDATVEMSIKGVE